MTVLIDASRTWRQRLVEDVRSRAFGLQRFFARARSINGITAGHIHELQRRVHVIKIELLRRSDELDRIARSSRSASPSVFLGRKEVLHRRYLEAVSILDLYQDILLQRTGPYRRFLVGCDRLATTAYRQLMVDAGWPAAVLNKTPPLVYLDQGRSPAILRRGAQLLANSPWAFRNPFPMIKLPYGHLSAPWSLTAILHEVAHDFYGTIPGLESEVSETINRSARSAGSTPREAQAWQRWTSEIFADVVGLLLGGPTVASSLMDILTKPRSQVFRFDPEDPHPPPYVRMLITFEALRRLGWKPSAAEKHWRSMYGGLPSDRFAVFANLGRTTSAVVDAVLRTPLAALRSRRLESLGARFAGRDALSVRRAANGLIDGKRRPLRKPWHLACAAYAAFSRAPARAPRIRSAVVARLRERGILRYRRDRSRRFYPIVRTRRMSPVVRPLVVRVWPPRRRWGRRPWWWRWKRSRPKSRIRRRTRIRRSRPSLPRTRKSLLVVKAALRPRGLLLRGTKPRVVRKRSFSGRRKTVRRLKGVHI